MVRRSKEIGAAPASGVASDFAPTPATTLSTTNGSSKGVVDGTASTANYCFGSLVTALDRAARIPKLLGIPKVVIPKSSVVVYKFIKLALLIIGLLACSFWFLPLHRGPSAVLYKYFPKTKSLLQQIWINNAPERHIKETPVDVFLPYLATAPVINTTSFKANKAVNVGSDSVAEYKIINTARHLEALMNATVLYQSGQPKQMHEALDSLFVDILPHVHRDGSPISLEHILYYGLLTERGSYFPRIHWDLDWSQFPTADGFQIWFLMKENDRVGGNMFLASTDDLDKYDPPVYYIAADDGSIMKTLNIAPNNADTFPTQPLKTFADVNELGLKFRYLDMHAGDCLIFSKRTLHMSDPGPALSKLLSNRVALRLIVPLLSKNKDTIPFFSNSPIAKSTPMNSGLKHMALKLAKTANQISKSIIHVPVSRYDMLDFSVTPWLLDLC